MRDEEAAVQSYMEKFWSLSKIQQDGFAAGPS